MSTTFNMLEQRMETFWNKLNEIQTHNTSEHSSQHHTGKKVTSQSAHNTSRSSSKTSSETKPPSKVESQIKEIVQKTPQKPSSVNLKSSVTESDSVSETESNRIYASDTEIIEKKPEILKVQTEKSKETLNDIIEELKSKVKERKDSSSSDGFSSKEVKTPIKFPITPKPTIKKEIQRVPSESASKLQIKNIVQTPVVKKVFSKPIEQTTSESESESSESSSEEEEEEELAKTIKEKKIPDKSVQKTKSANVSKRYFRN